MMKTVRCEEHIKEGMFSLSFVAEDEREKGEVTAPRWGMTVRAKGSMRYRIAETNENRIDALRAIAASSAAGSVDSGGKTGLAKGSSQAGKAGDMEQRDGGLFVTETELTHSKIVIDAKHYEDAFMRYADGIITANRSLLLVVTVADCVPIFLYDKVTGVFGVVHSGWKGTGIAANAIDIMIAHYGTKPSDVVAVIGPHIQSMCYTVDEDRARAFAKEYGDECVTVTKSGGCNSGGDGRGGCSSGRYSNESGKNGKEGVEYHLSLLNANLCVLRRAGVKEDNITAAADCTCCSNAFGSFRRETKGDASKPFTVQAAFCGYL